MSYDSEQRDIEIEELQARIDDLFVANGRLRAELDDARDVSDSLAQELEDYKTRLKMANSVISRLRTHIAQGIEL